LGIYAKNPDIQGKSENVFFRSVFFPGPEKNNCPTLDNLGAVGILDLPFISIALVWLSAGIPRVPSVGDSALARFCFCGGTLRGDFPKRPL